jgi:hypothetical protein
MASHFGRAEQGNAEGVVCEYERHGRPIKLKTRVTSREKEETWQAREIWATGVLQTTAQTKEQTWQAVYLAILLVRKERQEALSRSLAIPQPRHGRPLHRSERSSTPALIVCREPSRKDMAGQHGARHLTAWTSAVAAALSTPRPRIAAGASPRRRNRPGVAASS